MSKIDRRTFLSGAVKTAGAAAALNALPASIAKALAIPANVHTGTIRDIKHIVVLMQENRSFDHYFGAMRGVRGFGDRLPVPVPGGEPVWNESDGTRVIKPFHLDSATVNALRVAGNPHTYMDAQDAWSQGRFGLWPKYKSERSMGYYRREDVPFQYALAESFTLCDAYHCAITGGTDPNRIVFFSGSNYDPATRKAGMNSVAANAEINNLRCSVGGHLPTPGYSYSGSAFTWKTLPELLQDKGVSWRIYQDPNNNWNGLLHGGLAFESFRQSQPGNPLYDNGMTAWSIEQLAQHVAAETLPEVSWILPTPAQSEHPGAPSSAVEGAAFIDTVLSALTSNPKVWSQTALFITFDENDGFFDHLPPPAVPSLDAATGDLIGKSSVDVTGEYLDTQGNPALNGQNSSGDVMNVRPWGCGPRVPMYVVSPWTKGGWINSETFTHTSLGRFLEKRFDIHVPAISPWHRAVAGDLTSIFDFESPNSPKFPTLPDTSNYQAVVADQLKKPAAHAPATPAVLFQETGMVFSRALPYELHVTADVDVSNGHVQLKFNNTGNAGAVFHVYDRLHLDRIPRRYTVEADKSLNDRWDTRTWDAGKYDLEVHGPNGFLRTFKGTTMASAQAAQPEAKLAYDVRAREVVIKAHNDGRHNVKLTLVANAYRTGGAVTLNLQHGDDVEHHVSVDHSGCWYDLTVSDASSGFERRFAGRMETGRPSVTDPAMATELS
ncbi:phospholipase C, phosphocholine-specific [Paraburkholderia jirisanensis]